MNVCRRYAVVRSDRCVCLRGQPVVCELFYVLQEWARSATFLWMFLEGYYLHSTLTRDVFNEKPNFL